MGDEDQAMIPLATYILDFLSTRNGRQLESAFGSLSAFQYDLLVSELARILRFGGPPPNWVRRAERIERVPRT